MLEDDFSFQTQPSVTGTDQPGLNSWFLSPQPAVMSGSVPKCSACGGVVKPDIVFFGEELPPHFLKYLTDFPLADLLIIMGTSLEVRKSSFCLNWSEKQFSCAEGRRSPRHAAAMLPPFFKGPEKASHERCLQIQTHSHERQTALNPLCWIELNPSEQFSDLWLLKGALM